MSTTPIDWTAPSSPADQKKIADAIEEMVNSLTRMAGEKDHIRAIRERLEEEFEMPKGLSYMIAQDRFKDAVKARAAASETYQMAVNAIFPGSIE